MSVVKSKRKTSSTQFLVNIQSLQKEVLTWCKSQGAKNAPYGLTNANEQIQNLPYLIIDPQELSQYKCDKKEN